MSKLARYLIKSFSRKDKEGVEEELRILGLETWEMISVLPGSREDPNDTERFTCFFVRDASTDIGL